jgi:hypothetical protein
LHRDSGDLEKTEGEQVTKIITTIAVAVAATELVVELDHELVGRSGEHVDVDVGGDDRRRDAQRRRVDLCRPDL